MDIVKPRWLLALLTCLVATILAPARLPHPRSDAPARSADAGETVYRHYL